MHTTAEKRHKDFAKAIRKRRIERERNPSSHCDQYDNLHQYSKNKINCPGSNGKCMRDKRKQDNLDSEENDFYNLNEEKDII